MELENAAVSGLYPQQLQPNGEVRIRKSALFDCLLFCQNRHRGRTPTPRLPAGPSLQRFSSSHLM